MRTYSYSEWFGIISSRYETLLESMPIEYRDRQACLFAVAHNGKNLEFVPMHLRDREMCQAAVNTTGLALRYVPRPFRDYEMCRQAVTGNRRAIKYVPRDLVGREFLSMLASAR
jgi:hypothetical protein